MKLSIATALLCLTPFLSVASGDDVTWNGKSYRMETIAPISVDAYGRIRPLPPVTILVRVTPEPTQSTDTVPAPRPAIRTFRAKSDERIAATRFRFANESHASNEDVTGARSEAVETTTAKADDNRRSSDADGQTDQRTAAYRDSRLFERRIF